VDVVDMLPAGASAVDDDEDNNNITSSNKLGDKKGKKVRSKARSTVHYDDEEDEVSWLENYESVFSST